MSWGSWLVVALIAAVVWTGRAYFWPYAPCRWCKGKRTNRGSSKKRFGNCWRCRGSGMRRVLGSRQVHKAIRGIRSRSWETKR